MKRSEINNIQRDAAVFFDKMKYILPPFAYWNADEWKRNLANPEYNEIRENMLGWDITDFGSGDYNKIGLFLFTVRNGNYYNSAYTKPYAEKIMIANEDQITPYHYHSNKMEDIINRGGGNLLIKLYNSTPDGILINTPVTVNSDGRSYKTDSGSVIRLTPGESITLQCGLYHQFWGEEGFGRVLIGEVSKVNDDRTDNHFLNPVGRFPDIEEDVPPLYLLGQDYFK